MKESSSGTCEAERKRRLDPLRALGLGLKSTNLTKWSTRIEGLQLSVLLFVEV